MRVVGFSVVWCNTYRFLLIRRGTGLESLAEEGNSPVVVTISYEPGRHPSTTGHVEPCWNQRGPPRKAKYSSATDSEQVP